jgi:hypothetical protein
MPVEDLSPPPNTTLGKSSGTLTPKEAARRKKALERVEYAKAQSIKVAEEAKKAQQPVSTYEVSPGKTAEVKQIENAAQINIAKVEPAPEDSSSIKGEGIVDLLKTAIPNSTNQALLKTTASIKNSKYNLGSKSGSNIDCSAFAHKLLTNSGYNVPTDDLSSQGIWANSQDKESYNNWGDVPIENLRPGTVIALDTGEYDFDKNRKWGIDHIGIIVHDDKGRPMIAESAGSKDGVAVTPWQDRMEELKETTTKIYTGNYGNENEPDGYFGPDLSVPPSFGLDDYGGYQYSNSNTGANQSGSLGSPTEILAGAAQNLMNMMGIEHDDANNVLSSLEEGATMEDVETLTQSYLADKIGSKSEIVNEAAIMDVDSIEPSMSINTSATIDQPTYTSRNFVLNLNNVNGFEVLPNITTKWQAGGQNINDYYNNYPGVKGDLLFSAQQGQKNSEVVVKGKELTGNIPYRMVLTGGQLKIKKSEDIKDNDDVLTTKKIFKMEDLDIDAQGNINTEWDNNIGALIPKTKSGNHFVIGLTDTKGKGGTINVEDASQYGRSRGGSFIVFSDDTTQQYMVGGSFKDLYGFYEALKSENPNKEYSIMSSDTGTYSYSMFPKKGSIDGDLYRKASFRNTWGNVAHLVLTRK